MSTIAAPAGVRFEHRTDDGPVLGIGTAAPRLSWIVPAADPSFAQDAYEVEVTRRRRRARGLPGGERRAGPRAVAGRAAGVARGGAGAGARVERRGGVGLERARDGRGGTARARGLDRALRQPRASSAGSTRRRPCSARAFDVPGEVTSARLYATAHGVYEATLNGRRVGDHVLAPGWTAYADRLRYQTYDVTDLVRGGANELEVLLGNGWFRGRLGWGHRRALYGDRLALLAQLEVTTADGQVHVLATDGSWTARESGILADDLYDGQRTDLRVPTRRSRPARGERPRAGGERPGWT